MKTLYPEQSTGLFPGQDNKKSIFPKANLCLPLFVKTGLLAIRTLQLPHKITVLRDSAWILIILSVRSLTIGRGRNVNPGMSSVPCTK